MKRGNKNRAAAFVSATLVALSLVAFIYINQLTKTTDASVVASMQELSRHDMQNIQSELESSWDSLSAVYIRTMASRCGTIQEICGRLNLEQISNIFNTIYLVDSNGNTYSGANVVKNESEKEYVLPLLSGQQKIVMRYDNVDVLEAITESLVYGVLCEPFEVEGIRFIGIIGFSKISLMAERLKIDSFDGRGYTGIIDIDGNYVVNRDRSAGIGKIDNYFDQLRKRANHHRPAETGGRISAALQLFGSGSAGGILHSNARHDMEHRFDGSSGSVSRTDTAVCIYDSCNACGRRDRFVPDDACNYPYFPDLRNGKSGSEIPRRVSFKYEP